MTSKQMDIPGTERPKIKEIEAAAEAYVDVRDKRMKLTEKEVTAQTALVAAVVAHTAELSLNSKGEFIYRYGDDEEVVLKQGKKKAKVRHVAAEDDADEDDE
jgi:hypothetical protein